MTLGERILKLRKERYMSQEELAERVEVSKQSVSKWELDKAVPNVDKVIRLCDVFEISTDYLLKGGHEVPDDTLEAAAQSEKAERTEGMLVYENEDCFDAGTVKDTGNQKRRWNALLMLSICVTVIMLILVYKIVIFETLGSKKDSQRELAIVERIYTQYTLADVTSYSEEAGFITKRVLLDLNGVRTGDYIYGYADRQNPQIMRYPYKSTACVILFAGLGLGLLCSGIFACLAWKSRNRKLNNKDDFEVNEYSNE